MGDSQTFGARTAASAGPRWTPHWTRGPFTNGRAEGIGAGHGRWRTPVSEHRQCWKACWGQPFKSSNLLSSDIPDQR
jgi:hypothetical protein